jgi:hypothetical protein
MRNPPKHFATQDCFPLLAEKMKRKRIAMSSIALATLMVVSLFAVVSSAASVSGQASGTITPLAPNLVSSMMTDTGPAASTSFTTGQTQIFAVDSNGTLWNTSMALSGNGTWNPLGGVCTSSPAAVSMNYSYLRIDVFVRGSNGDLYHKYYQNGWSGWESLGGQLAPGTGPAVASWSAGRLDVFVEGTNGALYHKWWTGTSWSGWQSLGGKLTSSPAATSNAANNIYVFVRGTDGAVWQKSYHNGWSSWKSLGGQVAPNTGPAVSQDLWLFIQGTDHQLWRTGVGVGSAKSTGWGTLGGAPPEALSTSSPGAVVLITGQTLVCVSSTTGNVWYSADSLDNWKVWQSAGSPPVTTYQSEITQGIANDGTYNYAISNTALYKCDANWNVIMTNGQAAAQCGGNHFGPGPVHNGILYVLCTEDPPAPELAHLGLFNASNLSFLSVVNLTNVTGNPPTADQMNIGGVAVNPDAGLLAVLSYGPYGSTAVTNAPVFTFNLTTFAYEGSFQASNHPTIYNQGICYYAGHYYYSYDNPPVGGATSVNGGVAVMNTDGTNTTQIIPATAFVHGGEIEGLDFMSDFLRVLCGRYVYTFPFQATWGQ